MASSTPEWTTPALTTLMHGLALSPADASTLLPHTDTQITALVRRISESLNNPPRWTSQRHTRAVLKSITGVTPPPKPRKKRDIQPPKHRISLQLVPATPHDDAKVRAVAAYPFLEVVLKGGRRVWDVVKHLYQKWGLPVAVEVGRKAVSVDTLVCELVERGCRTVRLPYRVLSIDIDWAILGKFVDGAVRVAGKRRVSAPRDDDLFWTGGYLEKGSQDADDAGLQVCVSQGSHQSGEEAVMTRLRGHLERLDSGNGSAPGVGAVQQEEPHDPAIIPERFLRSCSKFELAHSLPDSLLSLGKSDGSGQALQVMNDALDLRDRVDRVGKDEVDLRCDERLDGEFLLSDEPSLGLSSLFRA